MAPFALEVDDQLFEDRSADAAVLDAIGAPGVLGSATSVNAEINLEIWRDKRIISEFALVNELGVFLIARKSQAAQSEESAYMVGRLGG